MERQTRQLKREIQLYEKRKKVNYNKERYTHNAKEDKST